MTLEELKQEIAERTGVPALLLTGETAEENIAQAKALLAYKRDAEADIQRPRSTTEQFTDWLTARDGIEQPYTAGQALADIEERARVEAGGYPMTMDGGEVTGLPDARPAREQFADWLNQKKAFNPFKQDGWTPMN